MAFILHFFIIREQKKLFKADQGKIIVSRIKSVINKRFPELFLLYCELPDLRKHEQYSLQELLTGAMFMFIFKQESRNSYNNKRTDEVFAKNYYKQFKLRLPHPDTIDDIMRVLPPEALEALKAQLVGSLIEQKLLRKFRFLGTHYYVAVDATGIQTFDHQHCKHCLTKKSKNGTIIGWFHYVLEAKLVTSTGFAISLASEFIENVPGRDFDKQDCERKAFVRLAAKIKDYFPRLPICILGDGLYPNNTVFEICRRYNWTFIITLKDGCLKTFQTEVKLLRATAVKCEIYRRDTQHDTRLEYSFLNDIEYDGFLYQWIHCKERKTRHSDKLVKETNFVFITNVRQTLQNVVETADGGRLRWKIENEGFNTQKNLGYELQHKFSRVSYAAMQNYYQILQIAHMINQFVENSPDFIELLNLHSGQTIKALWDDLLLFFKSFPTTEELRLAFLSS